MPGPCIETFVLGDFQTSCFVVTAATPGTGAACWIVDCGFDPEPMLDFIDGHGLRPAALLLTHAHADHIAGVDAALDRFGPMPLHVHAAEQGFCSNPMLNLSGLMGMPVTCTEPDRTLADGDRLTLDGDEWRVVHVPGHSPGCVMFVHDDSRQAIVGDTLFAGSMGRVDFPTSDPGAMRRSLDLIMTLPDVTVVHPGHGPSTTIGHERTSNPFLRGGW